MYTLEYERNKQNSETKVVTFPNREAVSRMMKHCRHSPQEKKNESLVEASDSFDEILCLIMSMIALEEKEIDNSYFVLIAALIMSI